jgi:hypothetical protein
MLDYGTNESWYLDGPTMEVRFKVKKDGQPILCRVTHECIEDHCGNPKGEEACLTAAREHFDAITDRIGELIELRRFELDGSVLLKTADWRDHK